MVRWKGIAVSLSLVVVVLLGMMTASMFLPDSERYANVVEETQDRLLNTVRQIEFYKLRTGSYPTTLTAVLGEPKPPITNIEYHDPIPIEPPVSAAEPSRPVSPPIDPTSGLPEAIVAEPVLPLARPNCVKERIIYRDRAVSDLEPPTVWLPPASDGSPDDCPNETIIYRDRLVVIALPGSDVITDPTTTRREAFFYERIGDDRYYLRAVGPDGVAFTGDDIFPQIERTDATRIGLLEARQSVAAVEKGG